MTREGHVETLDCPCRPEPRLVLGGGRVFVHRQLGLDDGRETEDNRAPDRYCRLCGIYHMTGHAHLARMREIRSEFRVRIEPIMRRGAENERTVEFLTR